jgi:hypothetical protein
MVEQTAGLADIVIRRLVSLMNRVKSPRVAIGLILALVLPVAGCYARTQVQWNLALPSGETVTIVRESHQSFENVSHEQKRILAIHYMTDHTMDDGASLQMEARRVFAAYKTRIDVSDFNTVSLAAMKKDDTGHGIEGRPYYFEKLADGRWMLQP